MNRMLLEKHWVNHINTLNTACTAFNLCSCWMPVKKTYSFCFFSESLSVSLLCRVWWWRTAAWGTASVARRCQPPWQRWESWRLWSWTLTSPTRLSRTGAAWTLLQSHQEGFYFYLFGIFGSWASLCFQVGRVCSESSRPAQRRKATVWREQRHALPQFRQLRYVRLNTHRRKSMSWCVYSMLCLCACSPMWRGGVRPVARRISPGGRLCVSRGRSSVARCRRLVVCQWWCHWWDLLFLCLVLVFWLTCLETNFSQASRYSYATLMSFSSESSKAQKSQALWLWVSIRQQQRG